MKTCSFNLLTAALFAIGFAISPTASIASSKLIVTPGNPTAVIMLEAATPGATQLDLSPRKLLEAMNVPLQTVSGGSGKILRTPSKDLTINCVIKDLATDNVLCTLIVKPSARAKISLQSVELHDGSASKSDFSEWLVENANGRRIFQSEDGRLQIDLNSEFFDLRFQ